jgi:hypothetical protein
LEEQVISFETAKQAREKGFELRVCGWYNTHPSDKQTLRTAAPFNHNFKAHGDGTVSAPRQALLQKWLRDKHNLDTDIWCNASGWGFNLNKTCGTSIYEYEYEDFTEAEPESGMFKTYEQALEKALQEALKLIKE